MKVLLAILLFASTTLAQLTVTAPCQQATVGATYSCQLSASQTGAAWTLAGGVLPPGLSLSQAGLISGTPTTAGSYSSTIQATVPNSGTATVTISVAAPPLPATGTLCPQMSKNVKWPAGYAMYNDDFGGNYPTTGYIKFVPTHTGTAIAIKWYNSADSHGLRDACSKYYGSSAVSPCVAACGAPQNRYIAPSSYAKACPNGWNYYAQLCASNPLGCYSAGTGGKMVITLQDLASATIDQPTVKYGFHAAYPDVYLTNGVPLTAGQSALLKIQNTDPSPKSNWFSWNFWTPNNLFTIAQVGSLLLSSTTIGGKSGVANAVVLNSSSAVDSKFQPIFAVAYSDGTCSVQGF